MQNEVRLVIGRLQELAPVRLRQIRTEVAIPRQLADGIGILARTWRHRINTIAISCARINCK